MYHYWFFLWLHIVMILKLWVKYLTINVKPIKELFNMHGKQNLYLNCYNDDTILLPRADENEVSNGKDNNSVPFSSPVC